MRYTTAEELKKDEIVAYLKEALPDFHNVGVHLKVPVAEKDKTYSVFVRVKGKKVNVVGNYASPGKRAGFTLSMFGLGIIPPLIWFLTARNPGFKNLEKEVVAVLQKKWPAA